MLRLYVALALLLAAGCDPCPVGNGEPLTLSGEPPPYADEVVAEAAARCDRPLLGRLTFVRSDSGALADRQGGHCDYDRCGMAANVKWDPSWADSPGGPTAMNTALAHEIGHYCLQSEDEPAVEAWSYAVNVAVLCRLTGHDFSGQVCP